ncbi:hypothetical protein [Aporhodopirellula aestuarii]|uniref:CHRD domain-containing protein n=1 Tax=Aporhodopirellula aestuarii TaxID=2950107 RepID=A0ABT0U5Q4_9BACT|nr:hypothetical protein [Aporhodopirellula aestuarii]MCM2372267.1 hypothetical protein [Aporhodopirellula aestuarii]
MKIQSFTRRTSTFHVCVAITCLAVFAGCKQNTTTDNPAPEVADSTHDHAHADGEAHDHSVLGHGHGAGPHDGTLADWGGGKYHVEFTVDHDQQQATVFVLGGDEKSPEPIAAESIELSIVSPEVLVTLTPSPLESDPAGKSSRFIGTHESLGVVQEYEGTLTGVIDGTPYSGDFLEEAHEH